MKKASYTTLLLSLIQGSLGRGDPDNNGSSGDLNNKMRSLFEQEFEVFFNNSVDGVDRSENASTSPPTEYVPFQDQLENMSQWANFTREDVVTARGDTKAAFYFMEWFMTGPDLGCTPIIQPHIRLQCSHGGRIHVNHACFMYGVDTAICLHPYPENFDFSFDYIGVWCSGANDLELGLRAQLRAGDISCSSASGEAAHGISLGFGCGSLDSEGFQLITEQRFCRDEGQYVPPETWEDNPRCMSYVEASVDNLQFKLSPVEAAATPSLADDSCIYSINT